MVKICDDVMEFDHFPTAHAQTVLAMYSATVTYTRNSIFPSSLG